MQNEIALEMLVPFIENVASTMSFAVSAILFYFSAFYVLKWAKRLVETDLLKVDGQGWSEREDDITFLNSESYQDHQE
ncbi:hypothetical protein Pan241w_22210 [Gimesia alba]|uniref:Uncharacterized protein n=1 Tax=Gimesia alba TaxID=2527973 RepID=A0A517RE57_9PLAN|nr:hypothetical protein [Gimesia alba]QDT42140.1 hypothetical protein Pan241w_22210 [Gimesia alba]